MMNLDNQPLRNLIDFLITQKIIDKKIASFLQQKTVAENITFLRGLIDENIVPADTLISLIKDYFNLPLFKPIYSLKPTAEMVQLFSKDILKKQVFLPIFMDNESLFILTDDPTQENFFKKVQFTTERNLKIFLAPKEDIFVFFNKMLHPKKEDIKTDIKIENSTIAHLERILTQAIEANISDIHIEPTAETAQIRYRRDGLLYLVESLSLDNCLKISTRIKVLANLDIAEKRVPQDGHMHMSLKSDRKIDFRISTCPTITGEKLVIRILDRKTQELSLDHIGLSVLQKNMLLNILDRPEGMMIISGPTGSGKTASLYAALNYLNTGTENICTVEDPVEIHLAGINQVQINPKAGINFNTILRSFLRQDPDIIMVGEIRDLETAELAMNASQTGHKVLSTLHTKNTAETLIRLIHMGIPNYIVADSVTAVLSQRLIRTLCSVCKIPLESIPHHLEKVINPTHILYKANGCTSCHQGYQGRTGIFELLVMNSDLTQIILNKGSATQILNHALNEGMVSLHQSGIEKLTQGVTSFQELKRISMESHNE